MRSNSQLVMSYCWSISLKWLHQYIGWLHTFSERNGFSSSQSQLLSNAVTSEKGIALPTTISWCPRSGICYRCYLLVPWCLMTNTQLRSISSCNSTKYSQLCCFHTWICCLENHRPIERHLTTTGVTGSKTLYCISTVLGNMKAHIHWRIRFLLHSCLTEIILNKPSKTDSDSSTAGIAQENFVSVRGKILPRLILLQTASSWFILILEVQALFVASTWMAASHNLLGFFAYSFVWSVGCCFSDAFDPIWYSPLGVWCGNSRAALTPQEQKEPQFRSEPSEKEKKKKIAEEMRKFEAVRRKKKKK